MNKLLHRFRIPIGYLLLATFCLYLTGCYSKTMIPLENVKGYGDSKTIIIHNGKDAGILKNPIITSTRIEGDLYNPFKTAPTHDNLGHIVMRNQMPSESDQINLYLLDINSELLFSENQDTVSTLKTFSLPLESFKGFASVSELNLPETTLLIGGILLGGIALIASIIESPHFEAGTRGSNF